MTSALRIATVLVSGTILVMMISTLFMSDADLQQTNINRIVFDVVATN